MTTSGDTGHLGNRLRTGWRTFPANLPLALLSIALATMLWVAVTNAENPTLRRDVPFQVPVQAVNLPRAYVVTAASPEKVNVTLIGPRDSVASIRPDDLTVRVDLSGAVSGGTPPGGPLRYSAPAEVSVRQSGVRAEALPASIQVSLEPEVRRVVPIRVNQINELPVGFELTETPSVQPAEATILGAKENVDLVTTAVADVKLDGLTVNLTKGFSLDPRDSAGHSIGHVSVEPTGATVTLKIRQVLFTRQVLVDPRVRGRPAPGYTVGTTQAEPSQVSVTGSIDALNQISTLATQDIDVQGATSDVIRTVSVQPPPGVTLSDPKNSIVVKVPVQPQSGPGSIGVTPKVVGLGPGLLATGQTASVVVNVTGPLPTLLRLAPADVLVSADVSGLGPGSYRIEPKVTLPAGLQLDGVVPDRVSVTIISSATATPR